MNELLQEPGVQITIFLLLLPIIFLLILILIKVNKMIYIGLKKIELKKINERISKLNADEISLLQKRKKELEFQLSGMNFLQ